MFDYAVVHDYLKENPIQKVKIRYRKEDGSAKPRDKFLEDDELKKFLNLNIRPVTHMVDFVNSYISLVYDMAKLPL